MRDKMRNHLDKSSEQQVDIKQGLGGLVDIEFLAQYLVLANSQTQPVLMSVCDNLGIFKVLAECGFLTQGEQKLLSDTYQKLRGLGHQATMQNESLLIKNIDFWEQENIVALWHKILLT
jgi:glutamate-ammonia-ligase adenylyltransferase